MELGLGIGGVKKSTCGVALNKELFDPISSSSKNVCVSVCVQNTSFCQRAGRGINSLPNDKYLDVTKLKACVEGKINVAHMMISVFDKVENIVAKGENAGNQHFLLFPQCFLKASFLKSLKVGNVW